MYLIEILTAITEQKSPKLHKEFVVEVDDRGDLYLQSLVNIIKNNVTLDKQVVKSTEFGDFIVFTKKDITLETSYRNILKLGLPILSLVKDYDKIEKTVKNFFKNTYTGKSKNTLNCCVNCPLYTTCYNKYDDRIYDGQYITMNEKVSIMYNFVKVGYDQYDIYDFFGKEVVSIEDEIFEIRKDRNGKKYLQLL